MASYIIYTSYQVSYNISAWSSVELLYQHISHTVHTDGPSSQHCCYIQCQSKHYHWTRKSCVVRVTWTPLNLPVVDHYTVHYMYTDNSTCGTNKRFVTFSASACDYTNIITDTGLT